MEIYAVDLIRDGAGLVFLNVGNNDTRAFAGEDPRRGGANAAGATGDDRNLSFQPAGHQPSLRTGSLPSQFSAALRIIAKKSRLPGPGLRISTIVPGPPPVST